MTLDDAHEYADILGCTPMKSCSRSKRHRSSSGITFKGLQNMSKSLRLASSVYLMKTLRKSYIYRHTSVPTLHLCVYTARDDYNGPMRSMHQTLDVIYQSPISEGRVHPMCNQKLSYVCLKHPEEHEGVRDNGKIRLMQVFPQPNNKYTLHNIITGATNEGVELEWATPALTQVHCPEAFFTLDPAQWS